MAHEEFRELYQTYYGEVLRFVRGFAKSEADVEEIVQDIFVNVYKNYGKFRGDASIRTWLLSIARNTITDYWRKGQKRTLQPTLDIDEISHTLVHPHAEVDAETNPEAQVQRQETMSQINECLGLLPEAMRLVLVCRAVHHYSTLETAAILEWSGTRVRVTYGRAQKKFRSVWSATYGQNHPGAVSNHSMNNDIC
jgi:RNA polymerase sigma-70 factor, ECF subfamily